MRGITTLSVKEFDVASDDILRSLAGDVARSERGDRIFMKGRLPKRETCCIEDSFSGRECRKNTETTAQANANASSSNQIRSGKDNLHGKQQNDGHKDWERDRSACTF